jgi:hypothetical protein
MKKSSIDNFETILININMKEPKERKIRKRKKKMSCEKENIYRNNHHTQQSS